MGEIVHGRTPPAGLPLNILMDRCWVLWLYNGELPEVCRTAKRRHNGHSRVEYFDDDAMDKTALAVTLLIALIAALFVLLRLYFGGQMSQWFG